jgi:hypothetical protein
MCWMKATRVPAPNSGLSTSCAARNPPWDDDGLPRFKVKPRVAVVMGGVDENQTRGTVELPKEVVTWQRRGLHGIGSEAQDGGTPRWNSQFCSSAALSPG